MRVESFKFNGEEINLPIFDEDEIEQNEIIENNDNLSEVVKEVNDYE